MDLSFLPSTPGRAETERGWSEGERRKTKTMRKASLQERRVAAGMEKRLDDKKYHAQLQTGDISQSKAS